MSPGEGENGLTIIPVAGQVGAEISGVHLSGDLDPAVVSAIRAALLKYNYSFDKRDRSGAQSRH
jgi:hypothetical protein